MRIALFTLESLANATAVRRFVAAHEHDLVLVGLSDPFRKSMGGSLGQTLRHLKRSGPRFLPYLAANFSLPRLRGALPGSRGNGKAEDQPLSDLCAKLNIPTTVVSAVNSDEIRNRLRSLNVDLLVSFHFDQIFDAQTLEIARLGGINVHPSLLPLHRGPVPTLYALLEQPPLFGVTVHRLVPQIDAGPILAQEQVALPANTTALRAASLLHERGGELLEGVLQSIEAGTTTEQAPAPLPYCHFPTWPQLRDLSRRGLKAADLADIRAALNLSIR
ncbi:formyltransferase family protein [Paraburkholderia ferrariae]|uniref:formyltransferase family protein n=1 Tax=Paraburkholderia ferrariae TaxID=386056 RepID=UPI0004885528|nr:formyltransferase family protein [Paraburkholderia ferrariae]